MGPEREPDREPEQHHTGRPGGGLPDLQHAATYGAVALIAFTMLKAYAAAYFSLTTAAALLTTAPINVFLGSMVSYSYQLFPLLALALVVYALHQWRTGGPPFVIMLALGVAVVAVGASPWPYLWQETLIVAGIMLGLFALSTVGDALLMLRKPAPARPRAAGAVRQAAARHWRRLITFRMVLPTFLIMVLAILLQTMTNLWLPVEVVVYEQGPRCAMTIGATDFAGRPVTLLDAPGCRQIVGHVLSDAEPWTTVVTAGDRRLRRIPTAGIRYRELCHLNRVQPSGRRPLLWVIEHRGYASPNLSCKRLSENVKRATLDPGSLP
ncbi:hypothetical protein [Actinoplanes awajinensis]|nr:hypothetical protein [Actinoplanes awajinensis]